MRGIDQGLWGKRANRLRALSLATAVAVFMTPSLPRGQSTAEGLAALDAGDTQGFSADDITRLVAPVALYPDPILALVLQASTQPLEVVQAHRFLEQRAKDPSLTADPDLDSSILGLMNYPGTLGQMNEYLDWTEALGDGVLDQLEDVQASVQDIRWSAYNTGILVSNDHQKVVTDGDVIRIEPADAGTVSVPQYDPEVLLAAIEPEELAEAAPPPEVAAQPPPAPAPAYYPQYAGPPVVSYGEPQSGFWDSAATFAGGAVVGGLLGWGLTEAFDGDDDYGGGRRVNIEDSTIVMGGDRIDNDRIQRELRDRRRDGSGERLSKRDKEQLRDRAQGVAPANYERSERTRTDRPKRDVKVPGGGTLTATRAKPAKTAAAGRTRDKGQQGMTADMSNRSQVAKDKARGSASRQEAKRKVGSAKSAAVAQGGKPRQSVKQSRGDGGMAAGVRDGRKAKDNAARGKSSHHGAKRRRG